MTEIAKTSFDRRAIPPEVTESHWTAPDGHPIRRIDWPDPNGEAKGSLLFMPGRGDIYEKYLETLDHWAGQGWRVTAADWRGQGASGRLGKDDTTGHIDDYKTWIADLENIWRDWTQQRGGPHMIVTHSMGGQIVLRALAEKRIDPAAVVLVAPMLGFIGNLPQSFSRWSARIMTKIGDPRRPAWKWNKNPGEFPVGRINLLTHDPDRYEDELWWREKRPELVMGPGSWGWFRASLKSMRKLDREGVLEKIGTPIMIVATVADKLVSAKAINKALLRLPDATMLMFGSSAAHEILREVDEVRDRALSGIDNFLDRAAKAR